MDASVHLNALNPAEGGSTQSQAFLDRLHRRPWPVHSPTLLLVEIAGAVARVQDDAKRGVELSRAVEALPGQTWVPLDQALAEKAAGLASECRLRGADAVYASVALRHGSVLVTRDREQLERLPPLVVTMTPEQALERLEALETTSPSA
ncbi:MAG: PIN domain-containing protein [Planctomycetes bacterium]|nr:PIN domain-containing protein [Planctomycetota bacterium]